MPVARGQTAAWARVNDTVGGKDVTLYVSAKRAPTNEDWDEYLEWYKRTTAKPGAEVRTLVYDRSPGPTPTQRKLLNDVTAPCKMRVAVVTPSPLIRGIVTAMNWFKDGYKAFAPEDIHRAFEFLGGSTSTNEEAKKLVQGFIQDLDR